MSMEQALHEFRSAWLPHVTDTGLVRLVELLEQGSPLLIHGAFSRACAMGCLATHIAWHHPRTCDLHEEAGVCWLTRVANLNPATSHVILAWDRAGYADWEIRAGLVRACRDELVGRQANEPIRQSPDSYSGTSGVARIPEGALCDTPLKVL